MAQTWKIRVQGSYHQPFKFRATFLWEESGARPAPIGPADLYAEGDLAAYLEEWGAKAGDICDLLDSLERGPAADITVALPDERLEMLWRR
jgi:hypothetical protein